MLANQVSPSRQIRSLTRISHAQNLLAQYGINYLYHMTSIDNLASILSYSLLSHNQAHRFGLNQTIKNKTVKSPISKSNLSNNNQSPSNKDLRIQLALILSELNIKVEEMRILTWDSLIKINDEYQIKLDKEKFIDIPLTIWQDLQQIKSLQNVTNNNELIISSKKKGKSNPNQPLAVNTIKKFISEGRKKQGQLQQLELPLGN